MNENCILCNPSTDNLVYRDESVIISHFPHAIKPGHIIVGIASHVRLIEDAPNDEFQAASRAVKRVCESLKASLGCERFYLFSVGDRDHHFHFHVVPKNENDPVFGPHAFSPNGWAGELNTNPPVPADPVLNEFIRHSISSV